MNNQAKGTIFVMISAFMWGIMGIFVRGLYNIGYTSLNISFVRCLLAGSIILIFKLIKNKSSLKINLKGLIVCGLYGLSAYCLTFICYSIAVNRLPIAVAIVLMYISPIWIALINKVVFKEKVGIKKVFVIIACIIGAGLVANIAGTGSIKLDIIGLLAGTANSIGVSLQIMIPKYYKDEYNSQTMLTYGLLTSAIVLFFASDKFVIYDTLILNPSVNAFMLVLGIGVLCTLVANGLYLQASRLLPTTTVSIMASLEVIVAMVFGYILYNEILSPLQLVGAGIVLFAAFSSARIDKNARLN